MKKLKKESVLEQLLPIYQAATRSDDGQRCMIAPSPEVREKIKKELKRLKSLAANQVISNLLTAGKQDRLGLNDGMILPGKLFPLGTSVAAVRAHSADRAPLRGTVRVIVILVQFPDKKLSQKEKHFEDPFFSTGVVSTGSVKEYYKEVTNGLIDIEGEVAGPFTLPHKLSYYANGASGMSDNEPNARDMAADAAVAANPSIDFSKYDNNHDDYVDAFVVIHAGRGAEETNLKTDIWSHKWMLPKEYDADGTKVYAYLTVLYALDNGKPGQKIEDQYKNRCYPFVFYREQVPEYITVTTNVIRIRNSEIRKLLKGVLIMTLLCPF